MVSLIRKIYTNGDKFNHFIVGLSVGLASIVVVATIAFWKELRDRNNGGSFDKDDLHATMFGGAVGFALRLALIGQVIATINIFNL